MSTFYSIEDYVDYLVHGGPGSGRYPKGSGKNPFQHVGENWFRQNIKSGKDKAPVSRSEKVTKETSRMFNEAADAAGRMGDIHRKKDAANSNAKKMSDQELNDAIRRMRLEREYNSLVSSAENGYDKAKDALSAIGTLIGIGASAATIASVIYDLKHPAAK